MQSETMSRKSRKPSCKVQIKNVPSNVSCDTVKNVVDSVIPGVAQKFEEAGAEGSVYVTFDTVDSAQQAVAALDGYQFEGAQLQVDFANSKTQRKPRSNGTPSGGNSRQDLPLRIVVGSEYVGAIIGKSGQTIKNITQQSRARVDIHREDNVFPETVVTIRGTSEACTKACQEIMAVVQAEAQSLGRGECPLRILCPNSLCGRIIGKKGNVIKAFMEKSKTNIVVSSFEASPYPGNMGGGEMNSYYVDRVITVTGKLEDSIKAEEMISEKMKQCYDQDINTYHQQQMMFGGLPTMPMMPGGMGSYPSARPPYSYMGGSGASQYGRSMYNGGLNLPPPPQQLEVIFLYIPEQSVGAVIGSKGQNIRNIMQMSGARIKIMGAEAKNGGGGNKAAVAQGQQDDRKVIITGSPEAQWKVK